MGQVNFKTNCTLTICYNVPTYFVFRIDLMDFACYQCIMYRNITVTPNEVLNVLSLSSRKLDFLLLLINKFLYNKALYLTCIYYILI